MLLDDKITRDGRPEPVAAKRDTWVVRTDKEDHQDGSPLGRPRIVLILGSAPDAMRCVHWARQPFDRIVAINNAWRIRPDWDCLIHAGDFPANRLPPDRASRSTDIVTADSYVPAQNAFGGFVYAGATMAFTAAYWVLHSLKPDIIAFLGCDMIYEKSGRNTHFYGAGRADPLRPDVTLQSLEAKSARLLVHAVQYDCLCVNLSELEMSRLIFPRATTRKLSDLARDEFRKAREETRSAVDFRAAKEASEMETAFAYYFEDGKYWNHLDEINSRHLSLLDEFWLSSVDASKFSGSILPR